VDRQPVARFMFPARHSRAEEYALCVEQALPRELQRPDVRAGLVEALTNAILHGAFGIRHEGDDMERYLDAIERAELELAGTTVIGVTVCAGDGRADVIVNDFGEGFDWQRVRAGRGRGLGILHEVFDAVSWNPGGNCVRLTISERGCGK
jgi:anti-sigma regulatory factor (Ser/Thr protein kinase)